MIWASEIKSWEKSRIFMYGLPVDFLSKGQKTTGGLQDPPMPLGVNKNIRKKYS